jgi:hypothetical protein
MTTPTVLALTQALLTPNLRDSLPIVIMLLMIQGIHPDIIFELIPYVQMSHEQYHAIIMAMTQLRLFASFLPLVKGVKHRSFLDQRCIFRKFPQNQVSRIFADFQNSILSRILVQCGFADTLPSLEVMQHFAEKIRMVRTSSLPNFPIGQLFLSPNADLVLLKTALQMQIMIAHVRSSYPDIVSFLVQNENAMRNIILVWKKQVNACELVYDRQSHLPEPKKITIIFAFCILAVIDPNFIDVHLVDFINSCGNSDVPLYFSQKYHDFLIEQDPQFECLIDSQRGSCSTMRRICRLFYSMKSSDVAGRMIEYSMIDWTLGFGHIRYSNQFEFESPTTLLRSQNPIFEVFSTFWNIFFRNFARTFAVSFLPIGNIRWSEGYTRLCATNFDWIIRIAVENFALRIGAKDNHRYLRRKISWLSDSSQFKISTASYGRLIFPEGIRNYYMSREISSCFLRDFWRAHQKPDPTMNDIEYIRWLFSIPEYASFGDSWIKLMDALQNGTELPRCQDGSSGDFSYLSCPTDQTDPEVQSEYEQNFKKEDGSELQISDYS